MSCLFQSPLGLRLLVSTALLLAAGGVTGLGAQQLEAEGAADGTVESPSGQDRGAPFRNSVRATRAVPRTAPIVLDGRLDEAAWQDAPIASGFIQKDPFEGAAAEEDSEVRVLFDEDAIYIGARLRDREPSRISRQLVRRDQWGNADVFEVSLDPNLDRRTGYQFSVSAANVQSDRYLYDDTQSDNAWDAVWGSAVEIDEGGWTVEIRIPLSQLRYDPAQGPQTWGVQFSRRRTLTNEQTFFNPELRSARGVVSRFGLLEGLQAEPSRRFEARPYLLSRARSAPATPGDPFFNGREMGADVGVDLRYGLGSAFTLDMTINPDFGQVESDPREINLSAFETFLREQRPFFVEDARILDFSLSGMQNRLYYSRRIGRAPQGGRPSGSSFVDAPDVATILGAAKVTGRTASGLSLGGLFAVTQGEEGRASFGSDGRIENFRVEPATQHGVVRLQQDLRQGQSVFGGILTGLNRSLPADGTFDWLPSNAFSGGLDFEHTWNDRTWALFGFFAGSHVRGDPQAMVRIQRASNHYFQRPDATRLSVDSTATSMTGAEWRLQLERRNGVNWSGSVWAAQVTPGFEINDLGFSRNAERLDGGMRIGYRQLTPGRYIRNYNVNLSTFHNVSHEVLENIGSLQSWKDSHVSGSINTNTNLTLMNYWNLNFDVRYSPRTVDRTGTRGGPLMASPASIGGGFRMRTDGRRAVSLRPNLGFSVADDDSGNELRGGFEVSVRPSPRMELEIQPSWGKSFDGAQFVGTSTALAWEPTYGTRYLFSKLDRETVSMETRLNVTFTPKLSLQLFAQPLLSSGKNATYRQLLAPRSYSFQDFSEGTHQTLEGGANGCVGGDTCVSASGRRYLDFNQDGVADHSFADRDFNVRSLRGNAVLRWEYRPGSTVFLVWQQNRSEDVPEGNFDLTRDLRALANSPAQNVFILKVNYWLGL